MGRMLGFRVVGHNKENVAVPSELVLMHQQKTQALHEIRSGLSENTKIYRTEAGEHEYERVDHSDF